MKILYALIKKEFFQIIRDFSSILIAFILPFILLLIYRYAINLDSLKINFGMKIDDNIQSLYPLFSSFSNNNYTNVTFYNNDESLINDLVNTKIRGAIIIENDFLKNLKKRLWCKSSGDIRWYRN